ncbi:MAG: acyl dehydratase, partial [Xanthobacteraceae bacterium]|nr:acyl dehydratase [Xanthobacteraceae bacterium]
MLDMTAIKPLYFEDIKIGMRESLMRTVMDEDVVGFAELTGDHNPVHLSDMYAEKTVFGQRIAHGLYT